MRFAEAAESKRTTDYVAAHVAPAGRVRLWCPGIHHRGSESLTIWLPGGEIRNDSAGKKGGHIWVRLFSLPTRVRGARQRFSRAMLHLDMQLGRQTFLP
jgi:hypothetical protein